MTASTALRLRAGWPLYLGMAVAGAAAVVASASTLAGLARSAGWAGWTPWLLPAALDVGGSAGGWCWLRPGAPDRARDFGRAVALVGAVGTLAGNALGHLIAAGYLDPGPLLVVVVGAVPAAVLVALAHLAALLGAVPQMAPTSAASAPDPSSAHDALTGTRALVLDAVRAAPSTIAELVQVTGRSRTTVVGHLDALTADGTVRRDEDKRYRPVVRPHVIDAAPA